jgi:Glycosyl transferases group 1.
MNILFVVSRHSKKEDDSTLTKDLVNEFLKNGHKVTVVTMLEKREKEETQLNIENDCKVLRVKTGNYFNVESKFEKVLTILTLFKKIKNAIFKYLKNEKYDLIITHTPFVATEKLIKPIKDYFKCPAYLILWDIFPQNAKDIGLIKSFFIFNYFKYKEKKMLQMYDRIFCMSEGNIDYLIKNYSYLDKQKIKLLRNWAKIVPLIDINKEASKEKMGFKSKNFIALFGGNMGKPQKLENILYLAEKCKEIKEIIFLFIGNGSEKNRIKDLARAKKLNNILFKEQVSREEYEKLSCLCDIGLVSLDERFTVPNFPSKTTDYFKMKLPIFAILDECSVKDYGDFLENKTKAGTFILGKNIDRDYKKFIDLYLDKVKREEMGNNGRKFYEQFLGVDKAYKIIIGELGE